MSYPRRPANLNVSLQSAGFTLMDVLIAVAIVGILAAIAFPSYTQSVVKTKRRAAQVCLASFATHMERYYTTHLRYDQTVAGVPMNTAALRALNLDCASTRNTGADYTYGFGTGSPTASTYSLVATPTGRQAAKDTACGSLSIDQSGARDVTGADGAGKCW